MTALLRARGLSAGYNALPVVSGLELVVEPGEVVALLGANGAGKTTTLLALAGELPLLAGEVDLLGEPVRGPLHRRARRGLGFVPEERGVFKSLSTRDTLRAGDTDPDYALTLFPELRQRIHVPGGLLSGGEQQMLSLGRTLSRRPKILLADEVSLGLAPLVVHRLLEAIRTYATEEGAGVLLVEQHVRKALEFADRVYVMARGEIRFEGTAREALENISQIEESYLTRTA
jgi:branched-chain amino acid transport system ATP-binding protein